MNVTHSTGSRVAVVGKVKVIPSVQNEEAGSGYEIDNLDLSSGG